MSVMRSFLSEVVSSLYDRMGDDISSLNIVLPSRRAGLFLSDSLSEIAHRPLWQPRFVSVGEIMEEVAGVRCCDNIKLVTELYKIYSRYHGDSFDSFYFWGEMLLSDFSQIDKYLIDADMLFANISDLREMESHAYLTPEQMEVISRFWRNFSAAGEFSQEKERFWAIWRTLSTIYHQYREALLSQGLAYEGMVHRMAAERIASDSAILLGDGNTKYIIAGFNALSECEKRIFSWLDKGGRAEFFWDYDDYYVNNADNEAGFFLRDNLKRFPATDSGTITHDHFKASKDIVAVCAPSDSMQCKYVYTFLQELIDKGISPGKETAIVLTDETLLQPVLHSIPEAISSVNVTMGYPLRQTTAYSFLERLLSLQSHKKNTSDGRVLFYHSDVTGLLNHPYVQEYDAIAADRLLDKVKLSQRAYIVSTVFALGNIGGELFRGIASWQDMALYLRTVFSLIGRREAMGESVSRRRELFSLIMDNICQVENSLAASGLEISVGVFLSLLRRVLQGIRIPYQGEPLEGIQIMGILETRNLDFENVLLLSANDDTFPGNTAVGSSFVPYNLRYAYGLPTPQHHDGVYAYYFYRLLQRASNVHIAYSSMSDDKNTGEPSRYIYQLEYESPHPVQKRDIGLSVSLSGVSESISVEKTGHVADGLARYLSGGGASLSPTAFYTYVECPLKFYFKYIARMAPEMEVAEEIDLPMFGTILHKAMELLYEPLKRIEDPAAQISAMRSGSVVERAVDEAICREYLRENDVSQEEYSGEMILVRNIVTGYIKRGILPYDASHNGFSVMELEHKVSCDHAGVSFKGVADRIDSLDAGMLRVVDYKTGSRGVKFDSLEALFSDDHSRRSSAVLQTMLYAFMMWCSDGRDVQPALYHVRYMNMPDFSPLLLHMDRSVERFSDYRDEFGELLRGKLAELFDLSRPFEQCGDIKTCQYCDFKVICRR